MKDKGVKGREEKPLAPMEMVENDNNSTTTPKFLYIAAFIINLPQIGVGCTLGWTSPTVPILMKEGSHIPLTLEEGTELGTWMVLGSLVGPLLVGVTVDRLGRRGSLQASVAVSLTSWLMLGFASSVEWLYSARFVAGVAISMMVAISPVYVAEISQSKKRGALTSMVQFMTNLGYLTCYAVGPFISYIGLIIMCSAPLLGFLLLSTFLDESPYYLVAKGKFDQARKSIEAYRGCSNINRELDIIEDSVSGNAGCMKSLSQLVQGAQHRRALFISSTLFLFLEFSGMIAVSSFTEPILLASGVSLSSKYSSMIIGFIKVIAGGATPFFTSRFGCKSLLMVSASLISITIAILGTFFYMHELKYNLNHFSWLPVTCLITYTSSLSIGLAPLPFVVMSEIFSPKVKAVGATLTVTINCFAAYIIMSVFSHFHAVWYICFWLFAFITLLAVPFVYFFLPDTRKMTLEDIQEWLKSKMCQY